MKSSFGSQHKHTPKQLNWRHEPWQIWITVVNGIETETHWRFFQAGADTFCMFLRAKRAPSSIISDSSGVITELL